MINIDILYPGFINALIQVESNGNDQAMGDLKLTNKAYGCLQIRKPYVTDINRVYGTKYNPQDCLGNRELSIQMLNQYMSIYATKKRLGHYPPTREEIARIHNGGPNGFKNKNTIGYWQKVQKYL